MKAKTMIAVRLPADIDERLTALAKRTGRTKTYYAREAILRLMDDMEDTYKAVEHLKSPERRLSRDDAEARILDGVTHTETKTPQVTDEKLRDLVRRIVETAHPVRILLFGSTARGNAGPWSDIDVLVVVPDGVHRRGTAQMIYRNLAGFGWPVDVVVATVSDMEQYGNSPGLVYREAAREGVELYAA